MIRKNIRLFISFFILFTSCNGQNLPTSDPYFVNTNDTTSATGPQNITRNILQDKNGNMWFASWEGIISYDGKIFTNHTLKDNLIRFHVFSLIETKTGDLWFGTIGGGAYRYEGKSFTLFTTKDGLSDNTIMCILEDEKGDIWFGTNYGLSCYDGKTFTNYNTNDGLENNHVYSMIQDKTGKFWFGNQDGISCYDRSNKLWTTKGSFTSFKKSNGSSFYNVRSIIEDKLGNIWIGSEEGLFKYDGKTIVNYSTNFTGYVFEDKAGNIWVSEGAPGGMSLSKYDGISFTKILTNDNQVFGITEDNNRNIWFGTAIGIAKYDGKTFNEFKN